MQLGVIQKLVDYFDQIDFCHQNLIVFYQYMA
jgi:hypothetical protein